MSTDRHISHFIHVLPRQTGREIATSPTSSIYYPEKQVDRSPHLSLHPSTTPRDRSTGRHISHFIHLLPRETGRQVATSLTSSIYYPERHVGRSPHLSLHPSSTPRDRSTGRHISHFLHLLPQRQVDRSPHVPLLTSTTSKDRSTGRHISHFLHLLPQRQVDRSPHLSLHPSTTPKDRSTGRHISHFLHLLPQRQVATFYTSSSTLGRRHQLVAQCCASIQPALF